MFELRDQAAKDNPEFAKVCEAPSFGKVEQPLDTAEDMLKDAYPREDAEDREVVEHALDMVVFPNLFHLRARALKKDFEDRMHQLFDSPGFEISIGPAKKPDRMVTKIQEAIDDEKQNAPFPRALTLKDALRGTVICDDGNAVAEAYQRIKREFKLEEGNGRLKNLLGTTDQTPPRMMITVIHEPTAGTVTKMLAEIQVHLKQIKHLAIPAHKYYELNRQPRDKFMQLIDKELSQWTNASADNERWAESKLNLQRRSSLRRPSLMHAPSATKNNSAPSSKTHPSPFGFG